MNTIKNAAHNTVNFVKTHKLAIAACVVAAGAIALQQSNRKAFYEFLESKGIDPVEYYCPEYYEELNS